MSLYIGTNYHPHDWPEDRWPEDIRLMKAAGFTHVRLGHLCWDSFEPDNGVYTFEWFDKVMNLMAEAGIGVVLDISMHPAPLWVHALCEGVNIGGMNGDLQYPVRRYMDDVSDPEYQVYALRFAETLVNRYKSHPALFAFGLCNELGWCHRSHSETSRQRFIVWLKEKYGTVEALNRAWSTQRWCRRLLSFETVGFPENEVEVGSPEAWLDMRRFFSDGVGKFIVSLQNTVKKNAPDKPTTSNHYAENPSMGFDYMRYYPDFAEYPGVGYYFNYLDPESVKQINNEMPHRIAETDHPMWCIEFQTGGFGIHHGPEGMLRMVMLHSLLQRTQMLLGWTWRTMLSGEEQFVTGLLDHDGIPNCNYEVYKCVSAEFKKLEKYAFPYVPVPEIGVAHSYDADWVNQYPNNIFFRHDYAHGCITEVTKAFRDLNRDYNIVDLKHPKHSYKLLILPEYCIMTEEEALYIRQYVEAGGTVIMTAYSGILDEHGSAYPLSQPANLTDVFGLRVNGYERDDPKHYREILELHEAEAFRTDAETGACLVSRHRFGKGTAYYTADQADSHVLAALIGQIAPEIGLSEAMRVPEGIQARRIADGQYFYVNTTDREIRLELPAPGRFVLADEYVGTSVRMPPYGADLLVTE